MDAILILGMFIGDKVSRPEKENVEGTLSVVIQLRNTGVIFMFHYNYQTDQGDETEGLEWGGIRDGGIGEGG